MHTNRKPLNIIFIGESYLGGMAGSKRIQNIIDPFLLSNTISVHNLVVDNSAGDTSGRGELNNVSYRIISYTLKNPFSFIRFYFSGFRFISASRSKGSKNILYCYNNPTAWNFLFVMFAKLLRFKIVVDIVEDFNLLDKKRIGFKKRIDIYVQDLFLRKITLYADAVLVISNYLKDKLSALTENKIPVYYLPISVNFDLYPARENTSKENTIKLFYGGSFGEKDGLQHIIEAFEKVADIHRSVKLILTGKPPKAGMTSVLNCIEASPVKDKINYIGYLNDEDYYNTLQSCDIFFVTRVNSSFANAGFPFKLGEMLATGKPVVASNIGDISRFLENKKNAVLVTPGSAVEISDGINFLIENPHLAKNIGEKGRETALKYFDAVKIASGLELFLVHL